MTLPRSAVWILGTAAVASVVLALLGVAAVRRDQHGQETGVQAPSAPQPGGHFSLAATNGQTVTDRTYRGKWELIYFGYTYCPDVCPTTLNAMADALSGLGPRAGAVQAMFITVDPARDTIPVLTDYVGKFDPRILGLTGSETDITKVAHEFGVYAAKRDTGLGGYLVDHSALVFILDPKGRVAGTFRTDTAGGDMAKRLVALMSASS